MLLEKIRAAGPARSGLLVVPRAAQIRLRAARRLRPRARAHADVPDRHEEHPRRHPVSPHARLGGVLISTRRRGERRDDAEQTSFRIPPRFLRVLRASALKRWPLPPLPRSHIAIIGAPLDLGQGRRGVDMGPSALRVANLNARVASLGYTVEDRGNVPVDQAEASPEGHPRAKYLSPDRRNLPTHRPIRSNRPSTTARPSPWF